MEKESLIYFFFVLWCGTCVLCATAFQENLCQEKAAIFNDLTRHLSSVLTEGDNENSLICSKLSSYISHALYTQRTCPELPLVKNSTYVNLLLLMKSEEEEK
ncbi:hypothetical protein EGW08_009488 [Elysia chlorotica]|uniref:Uncharacterized protein n=1 Tax=Elysia chlorotica TaxID=188477 RepID=A0A433TMF6_ELYCH|nr:hypothetical protein EGW08_009488 [Elysia chlorotica]